MMTDTMIPLSQFVAAHKITMTAERTGVNHNMSDMPAGSSHWRCILRCDGRQMTVPFSQGPAISGPPTVDTVLDCLASDAAGYINATQFEEWASEYGYDTDSRKAERIFKTVERQTAKLQQFIQDADTFNTLLFETERE